MASKTRTQYCTAFNVFLIQDHIYEGMTVNAKVATALGSIPFQLSSTLWNMRGGRWSSVEQSVLKNKISYWTWATCLSSCTAVLKSSHPGLCHCPPFPSVQRGEPRSTRRGCVETALQNLLFRSHWQPTMQNKIKFAYCRDHQQTYSFVHISHCSLTSFDDVRNCRFLANVLSEWLSIIR